MNRFALISLALVAVPMPAEEKEGPLDGFYRIIALSKDEEKAPDEVLKRFEEVSFKGDKYKVKTKVDTQSATIKIDEKAKPATIDLTPDDGPEKGMTLVGIWKLEKGVLTIALAPKSRPTNFDGKGVDEILIVMKSEVIKRKAKE